MSAWLNPDARLGHNGGPPLDRLPEWGEGPVGNYFYWRAAHRRAWKSAPAEVAVWRARKAADLGLTYKEYTLEILERGRHLQAADTDRIAAIKSRRQPSAG